MSDHMHARVITLAGQDQSGRACLCGMSLSEYQHLAMAAADYLSRSEIDEFERLRHERRQKSYLAGRYVAKKAISHYLMGVPLDGIEVANGVFGQPVVHTTSREHPMVTVSHDDEFAVAVAFPESWLVGIDIELVAADKVAPMKSTFTSREVALLDEAPLGHVAMCAVVWAAREALSKAIRCGLLVSCEMLEVDVEATLRHAPPAAERLVLRFVNFPHFQAVSWKIGDHVLSVVTPSSVEPTLTAGQLATLFSGAAAAGGHGQLVPARSEA